MAFEGYWLYDLCQFDQKAKNLETVETTLNNEYANIQKTELELVKKFNEKYGRGTLDLESGTFSPAN